MNEIYIFPASHGKQMHSTTSIRLIEPLNKLGFEFSRIDLRNLHLLQSGDLVLIDRYGDLDFSDEEYAFFVAAIKGSGAKVIHFVDDDLFITRKSISSRLVIRVSGFQRLANKVVVTTSKLAQKVENITQPIVLMPIFAEYPENSIIHAREILQDHITVGYMGTYTHVEDIYSVTSKLLELKEASSRKIAIEIVGGGGHDELDQFARIVGATLIHPPAIPHSEFKLWFRDNCKWDFGLAPLSHNEFNSYKSDIKVLDYAAIGAIPLVEPYTPYENLLISDHGVMTLDDLITRIEDPDIEKFLEKKRKILRGYVFNHRTFQNQKVFLESILNS